MEKEEVLNELKKFIHPEDTIYYHMMATKAYHQLGDISSEYPDLCAISNETPDYYVGSWVEGFGFFHVLFPKKSTRDLTDEEIEKWNGVQMTINSNPIGKLHITKRPQ